MVDELYSDPRLAALYERMYPRSAAADEFYLALMMASQCVLDVGCGTGALLHQARQRGHTGQLCGVDPAAPMLAQARRRADIEWHCADLAAVTWAGRFDLVVMTGHAFQVLIADHELSAALKAIRRALQPAGRFAFETRNPAARAWESWAAEVLEVAGESGAPVRMTRRIDAPFDGHTVSFSEIFSSPAWSGPRVSHSTLRFLDAATLNEFLAHAGLRVERQFGGFLREPLGPASAEIVTIARAA